MKEQKKKIIPASKGYEFWEEKIQEYKKRGLTQVEFCKENRLAVSIFTSWLRKLRVKSRMKCNARLAKIAMINKGRCHEKIHTYHI